MKMPSVGYGVYRWGDTDPSGVAMELGDAKMMLQKGFVEGEVRDATGKVVFVYKPKKPLSQRIEEARSQLYRAERAVQNAQFTERWCRSELKRLTDMQAAADAAKVSGQSDAGTLPLFAAEDGTR